MAEKCYKFRIYPTEEQERQIQRTFGCCRYVYNYYLAKRKELWETEKKTMSYFDCTKDLTQLKKTDEFLKEVDVTALRTCLKDLDMAYQNFFRGRKKNQNIGYPKFKSKKDRQKTYRSNNTINSICVNGREIKLPKLGNVKCRGFDQGIQGRILSATIEQTPAGDYYCAICCTDVEIEQLPKTGNTCGVDMGIKELATLDNGTKYTNNKYASENERRLAKLQRALSRKKKGSNRWEKNRIRVAKLQERIANQRKDNLQKVTTELIRQYDTICVEDLNVKGMEQNSRLAKSVADASFYEFRRELEYKAEWYGKKIAVVDRFFPSSQICSACGERFGGTKDLNVRKWACPHCGTEHDRDVNAAKNILAEGLKAI